MTTLAPPSEPGGRLARRQRERERRRRARRRRARRVVMGVAALAMFGVAAAATLAVLDGGSRDTPADVAPAEPVDGAAASGEQHTLLLVRTRDDRQAAASATLLAVDDAGATVVLIPTGTLVTVPGVGLDRLALAGQYGGARLVQGSVENLLGIAIDHVAAVDGPGLGEWLDRLGGLELDITRPLRDAGSDGQRLRLEPGTQTLDGDQLARYATFVGDENELDVITRQRKLLAALLEATAESPARAALTEGAGDASWPLDTDAEAAWMDRLLARAGEAQARDAVRFRLLPVEAVSGDGSGSGPTRPTYRADTDEIAELTQQHLAASVPDEAAGGARRVQVLNGVGTPGIGQAVEQRLGGGRTRIVASGNAPSFSEDTTRIVIYDDSDRSRSTADWVRQQLGVGTIQVSGQPQSVVDVTIVVGADFRP